MLRVDDGAVEDPVVLAAIFKLRGDVSLVESDYSSALKYYQQAQLGNSDNSFQIKYELDVAITFLAQDNYEDALQTLGKIIDNEDLGFNDKNTAEELMAYTKKKLSI